MDNYLAVFKYSNNSSAIKVQYSAGSVMEAIQKMCEAAGQPLTTAFYEYEILKVVDDGYVQVATKVANNILPVKLEEKTLYVPYQLEAA